jgi:butyryl-CoA dehydrogenase
MSNPLIDDQTVDFILHDVLQVTALLNYPIYAEHSPESLQMSLDTARRLARDVLFPAYKPMDEHPAWYKDGRVHTHPLMADIWRRLVEGGFLAVSRPQDVGGQQLPLTVSLAMNAYLQAANPAAMGFLGLTQGAAHLLESFGSAGLKERFMEPMYSGRWAGTMCLTEPHAGSSLADVRSRAVPQPDGHCLMTGSKVFISGGENSFTDNIVHMVLARLDGAPAGVKGVSLFAVPKRRLEGKTWVDNDVRATGTFHKMGWRGLPSIALQMGDAGRCHGWLVGSPNQGLRCMFQMMNEARLMVGVCAAGTASVGFQEALSYARTRTQGRALDTRDPASSQVPIIEHSDVRRMLLAQKSAVEGFFALLFTTAHFQDLALASVDADERQSAAKLVDLLTPMAKSWPSEKGFEANALAVQVHGGYGYTSEFLPEALLRDQKLNSIHEGTTGIHGMDLLGRKIFADGGTALGLLGQHVQVDVERANKVERLAPLGKALSMAL